jgi:hypothetical protein
VAQRIAGHAAHAFGGLASQAADQAVSLGALGTYLLPVVPLVVLFDGIVSCWRTYTVAELAEFTAELSGSGYE